MTAYRRGADFERRVKAKLEEGGYIVFRMAGSHSVADLIGFKDKQPYFIQCKGGVTKITKKELERFREVSFLCGAIPLLALRGMRIEDA